MQVKKIFESISTLKVYKPIKGFLRNDNIKNPARFIRTAPMEIYNRKQFALYLIDRKNRYQYNDDELGEHGLRKDEQNEAHACQKINEFEDETLAIERDLEALHKQGLHKVLQRKLLNIPPREWRNRI